MKNIEDINKAAIQKITAKKKIGIDVAVKPEEPKTVSGKPVEEKYKTEELKKEDKKVEAKAEKQTSEKK